MMTRWTAARSAVLYWLRKNCLMVLLRRSLSTLTDLWVSASMQINDMEPCVERNSSKHRLIGNRRLACGWILAVKIRWIEFVEIPVRLAIVLAGSDLLASFSTWVASPWPMAWLVDTTGVWWPYKCYGSYYNASVACLALELRAGPWVLQCGHEWAYVR